MLIGVTGNMGSGKTYFMKILETKGFRTLYSDEIVAKAYNDKVIVAKIESVFLEFGFDILDAGNISKKKIRDVVFLEGNEKILEALEAILHKYVIDYIVSESENIENELVFVEIPLLFEKELMYLVDKIILVVADESVQIERITKRDQIDLNMIEDILAKQLDVSLKKDKADYIIESDKDAKSYSEEVDNLLRELKEETNRC